MRSIVRAHSHQRHGPRADQQAGYISSTSDRTPSLANRSRPIHSGQSPPHVALGRDDGSPPSSGRSRSGQLYWINIQYWNIQFAFGVLRHYPGRLDTRSVNQYCRNAGRVSIHWRSQRDEPSDLVRWPCLDCVYRADNRRGGRVAGIGCGRVTATGWPGLRVW